MRLQGQDAQGGFAMAALLVSLAVMSVLMSVALPAWRQQAQREKEEELVFRGEQYARAIALYRAKNGNNFPPSVDVLVQGRYLRKKYVDPITKQDFDVIGVGAQPTSPGIPSGGRGATPLSGRATQPSGRPSGFPAPSTNSPGSAVSGGIMGVHSKSKDNSIRIYKGQTKYDQWNFVFTAVNRPGGNPGPGAPGIGGPGGARNPGGPGGRGTTPGVGPGRGGIGPGRGGRGGRGGFGGPDGIGAPVRSPTFPGRGGGI